MSKHEYLFLKDRVTGLKRVKIAASSSGNNTLVAAVTGKKLRVYQVLLVAAGAVNAKFQTGASGTDLTGLLTLTTNVGFASGWCPVGHFETDEAALLNLNLSGAVAVGGWLVYAEV
jgi:hypothetical protein